MQKQAIPLSVIDFANQNGEFYTLRTWIVLKQIYKHTLIYNLNYAALEKLTGISHTSLRNHIKRMVSAGWAKHQHGHLHLTGINKLKKHENETCVLVPVESKKSEQILQFRNVLVRRNIKNQEKQIKRKERIVNNCNRPHGKLTKSDLKLINKAGGMDKIESKLQSVTTLANKSIGKLFYRSQRTGQRIQSAMRNSGLIKTKPRFELFKTTATKFEAMYLNSNFKGGFIFNVNNACVYRRLSNAIVIGQKF